MAYQSRRNFFFPVSLILIATLSLIYGHLSRPVFATNSSAAKGTFSVATERNFLNANTGSALPNTGQSLTLSVVAGAHTYFYVNAFGTHKINSFNMTVTGLVAQTLTSLNNCVAGTTFVSPTICSNNFAPRTFAAPTMTTSMRLTNVFPAGSFIQFDAVFGSTGPVSINVSSSTADIVGVTTIS